MERVESKLREPVHLYPQLTPILHSLLDSGGKRLRPALALLAGSIFDADLKGWCRWLPPEMLHTVTLVHDDRVDGALVRRGSETLNARWSTGATVLAGDYLAAAALAAETKHVRVMSILPRR